jgi:hypothetical protein
VKEQVTHLNLDERHRRLLAMRSGQLGMTLSAYVSQLIDKDAESSGLLAFLSKSTIERAVRSGK